MMLTLFAKNIWYGNGDTIVGAAGFHFPTRMTVIKLDSGGLFIISPIGLPSDMQSAIDALGPVHHIVAPNNLHHTHLPAWAAAYPSAKVHGAVGIRAKQPNVTIQTDLENTPNPEWAGQIDQIVFLGNKITTEVVFFHTQSGTAVFTDLLQNMPRDWYRGWRSIVARLDLMTGDMPQVPRKFRMAFADKNAARTAVTHVLNWPTIGIIMAHGTPIRTDGATYLTCAFSWLISRSG